MDFFASTAFAQEAAAPAATPPADSMLSFAGPMLAMLAIFYFILIRPQSQTAKAHNAMITAIKRGDRVVTGGGIYGTVTAVDGDETLTVEIAPSVSVQVARGTVLSLAADDAPELPRERKPKMKKGGVLDVPNQVANDN